MKRLSLALLFTLVATHPGEPVPKSVNVEPSSGAVIIVVRDAPATMTAITAISSPERARPRHAAGPLRWCDVATKIVDLGVETRRRSP